MGASIFAMCVFLANLCLFYCSPPHHTTNMANVPSTFDVFYHMHVWKVSGCSNHCPTAFLLLGNMTCWPKCNVCVLEASIWYLRRIVTLGSSHMGMGWKPRVYCGALYWFYNQRRRYYISYNLAVNVVDYLITIIDFNNQIQLENLV